MEEKEKPQQKEENDMVQWNDVKDNNKYLKFVIPIIIIILIISCSILFIKKDSIFSNKEEKQKSNEIKKDNKKSKEVKETKEEKEPNEEKENKEETEEENKNTYSNSTRHYVEIDPSKSLNTKDYKYSYVTDEDENIGLTLKINNDKRSVTVTIYEKASKTISNIQHSTWSPDPFDKQITGFNKNIKSTYIGGLGQDVTGTILYFIMEDSTVQYAKLFERKTNPDGTGYYNTALYDEKLTIKEVPDINGIVKLYGANASAPQSTGYYTTLAAKADGSFYDLSQIIK